MFTFRMTNSNTWTSFLTLTLKVSGKTPLVNIATMALYQKRQHKQNGSFRLISADNERCYISQLIINISNPVLQSCTRIRAWSRLNLIRLVRNFTRHIPIYGPIYIYSNSKFFTRPFPKKWVIEEGYIVREIFSVIIGMLLGIIIAIFFIRRFP